MELYDLLHFTSPLWYGHEQILVYLHTGCRNHAVLLNDTPLLLILVWEPLGDSSLYLGWDEVGGVRQDSLVLYDDCARDSVTVAIGGTAAPPPHPELVPLWLTGSLQCVRFFFFGGGAPVFFVCYVYHMGPSVWHVWWSVF